MRKIISILICGLGMAFSSLYAVENVVVDSQSRNVINTGVINFAPLQLTINGVAVLPGGGGGGPGGGVTSITLTFPEIFNTPLSFTTDGLANWSAGATFRTQPAFTFFGNGTASTNEPAFMDLSTARNALLINNLDNTSDANKPLSIAATDANSAMQSDITTNSGDIATINTTLSGLRLDTIASPTANVSLAGFRLTSLGDPVNPTDGANKSYVDTAANVGPPHPQVAAASTGNLTLSGEQTIDGVATTASRVLVKDQTTASQNGIYVTAAGAWSRATDANTGTSVSGIVFVSGGTTQLNTTWGVTTPQPITLGTTSIAYTLTGTGGTTYTAGSGLALTTNVFSLATMGANTVKGNNTGSTALPTNIPASTVGFSFLGLTNPGAVTFPRINADNTVTARSAANFLTDIGAGTVTSVDSSGTNNASDLFTYSFSNTTTAPRLTVNKPIVAANTIYGNSGGGSNQPTFMTAATARTALGGTTIGQNIFQLTNPNAITFPRFNADNTVTAQTAANFRTDIGASQVDSEVTLGDAGLSGSPLTWTTGATLARETAPLASADRWVVLPPASAYPNGKRILYTDRVTTLNFGRWFRRNGTDTLNGGTADFKAFIAGATGPAGQKSAEFENIGGTGWQVITTASTVTGVQDPTNALRGVTFDVSPQPTPPVAANVVRFGTTGDSVTVVPYTSSSGILRAILANGTVTESTLAQVLPSNTGNQNKALFTDGLDGFEWRAVQLPSTAFVPLTEPVTANHPVWDFNSNKAILTLNANKTLEINNANDGDARTLEIRHDNTGGTYHVFLPSGHLTSGGTAGELTVTNSANAVDLYAVVYEGTNQIFMWSPLMLNGVGTAVTAPTPDVLWWKYNEGSPNTAITSGFGGGPTGTLASATNTWGDPMTGNSSAHHFIMPASANGIVTSTSITYPSSVLSVSFWVYDAAYDSSTANVKAMLNAGTAAGLRWGIFSDDVMANMGNPPATTGARLRFRISQSGSSTTLLQYSVPAPTASTWTNFVIVFDNNSRGGSPDSHGDIKIFKNGTRQTLGGAGGGDDGCNLDNDLKTLTGSFAANTMVNGSAAISARNDDVRVYGRELTQGEINAIVAAGPQ